MLEIVARPDLVRIPRVEIYSHRSALVSEGGHRRSVGGWSCGKAKLRQAREPARSELREIKGFTRSKIVGDRSSPDDIEVRQTMEELGVDVEAGDLPPPINSHRR